VNLSQAKELFLRFKERELSPRTVREYEKDLELFIKLVGDKPVSEVKTADLMLFRTSLNCSPSLINRRLSALSSFFNFLVDMEVVERNPVKPSLRIKKVKQRVPEALTKEEVEKLLLAARERGERDYMLIKTILYSGLRISEVLSLTKESVVPHRGKVLLRVVGKGNKERFVPLPSSFARELLEYCRKVNGERLFPLKYQGVRYIFEKLKEKTGLKLHPHKLRHTFATFLVEKGVDIRVIQEFLGHASPNTSARYAKVRNEVMFKVVEEVFEESEQVLN
jgi:integrase/recombinase XerD